MDEYLNDPSKVVLSDLERDKVEFKPMTGFDKVCAVFAIPIGVVFMVLGVVGLFTGSKASFSLPRIIGVLPFFLGWGMSIPLIKYWRNTNRHRVYRKFL